MNPIARIVRIKKPRTIGLCQACGKVVHANEGTTLKGITICYNCDTGLDLTDPIISRAKRGESIQGHKIA
jgi:hypothetical protein